MLKKERGNLYMIFVLNEYYCYSAFNMHIASFYGLLRHTVITVENELLLPLKCDMECVSMEATCIWCYTWAFIINCVIFFKADSIWSNKCLIRHAHPKISYWIADDMWICPCVHILFEDFMTFNGLSDRCYFEP